MTMTSPATDAERVAKVKSLLFDKGRWVFNGPEATFLSNDPWYELNTVIVGMLAAAEPDEVTIRTLQRVQEALGQIMDIVGEETDG